MYYLIKLIFINNAIVIFTIQLVRAFLDQEDNKKNTFNNNDEPIHFDDKNNDD